MNTARSTRRLAIVTLAFATALCGLAVWALGGSRESVALEATGTTLAPAQASATVCASETVSRQVAEQNTGHYAAPCGATFRYDLTGQFTYSVNQPEGDQQQSALEVRGSLDLAVVDRRCDTILVRVELRDLTLSALAGGSGSDEGGMGAAARQPFHAKLGLDGRIHGYQFAATLSAEQRNFVRGLFAAFMHTVPADAQDAWEAEDADAAGVFVARWKLMTADGDARVERCKLRYTAMAGNELHAHTLTGGSRAAFGKDIGWLRSVDVQEQTSMTMVDLGLTIELRTHLQVALRTHATQAGVDAAALWDATFLPAAGHGEDFSIDHEAGERARWGKLLAGTNLENRVDELAALLAAQPQDAQAIDRAWQAVIWMVKLDPEAASEIRARVAGMQERLADMLVSALGAAGTDAAQDVLAAMRHDQGSTPALRRSATIALFQVGKPTTRVLSDLVADLGNANELSGDQAMAMLLLGGLAPRGGEARIGGKTAFDALLGFEAKSAEQGRSDLWLNALSNAGSPETVPHVQRYLTHDDERVRAAAYNALRKVDTAPAAALLMRGLEDASPLVRTDAVNALGQHYSRAARAALIRAARDDGDATVRRTTLDGLAAFAKNNADARQAIELMAGSDPDAGNQKAARAVLDGLR